ncbi:RNA-directed DNA polymerase, eukaryota, reverse transcriptase zinc-binding domain protein [Tanacetum coccineum]
MAGGSFNNSKSDGWTWVFGKNKKSQSKSIDNPFVKDVKKIATSFFVTNFPESMDAKSLWKEFQPFGRIVDAFIANKRSKIGKRFGFVRHEKSAPFPVPKGKVELGLKSHEVPVRPNNNGHSSKQSYASVANGVVGSKGVSSIGTLNKSRSILLNEHDLIKVDNTSIVVLVKVKEVDMISNMYCIYRNEGFIDVKIHYVGGLWVWIEFKNEKICETFKSNVSLNSLWSSIMSVSHSFIVDQRLIWIEISGLPLCAWGSNANKKSFFDVHVKEIGIWSTRIINDLDGSDLDDSFEENKSHSSYENEDKNEELDDFIEQVVEDKIMSKSTNDFHHVEEEVIGMEAHSSSGSKPLGFENVLEEGEFPLVLKKTICKTQGPSQKRRVLRKLIQMPPFLLVLKN